MGGVNDVVWGGGVGFGERSLNSDDAPVSNPALSVTQDASARTAYVRACCLRT